MAQLATRRVLRSAELRQQLKASEERRDRIEAEGLAHALQGTTLTIGARVGARNRLHGEVTNQDVSDAIRDEVGIEVDRHKIEIERPIRSLGMFMLPVRIAKGLEASITVEILEESELAARQEAELAAESEEAGRTPATRRAITATICSSPTKRQLAKPSELGRREAAPQNIEAERSVLGSLLIDPGGYIKISGLLAARGLLSTLPSTHVRSNSGAGRAQRTP